MHNNSLRKCQEMLAGFYVEHLFGPEKIECGESEVIVLCLVRNGELYIEEFIEHYLKLGAKHIVFLDNGSTDKTIEIAKSYKNITILRTNLSFAKGNNMRMRDYLIDRFARDRWSLCVDIDEFFNFPFSRDLGFKRLLWYLNGNGYTALTAQILDMFSGNIVRGRRRKFALENYKYYTLKGLIKKDYFFEDGSLFTTPIKIHSGGVRGELFGTKDLCLTKHPLIFNDENTKRGKLGHLLTRGKIADISAVLLHYKFTDDFFNQAEEAVRKEQYFNNSAEYKQYFNVLRDVNVFKLKDKDSVSLGNVLDLVDNNFLVISEKYKYFADNYGFQSNFKKIFPRKYKSKEDVAVIIGIKDRFDMRLKNAFRSIRNQDYDQDLIKIILVDYGSREIVSKKIKRLCREHRAEYIKVPGVKIWSRARALNIGIKNVQTQYVLCSDVDIVFEKNYISECVKEMQKNPKQVIWSIMFDLPEESAGQEINTNDDYLQMKKTAVSRNETQSPTYPYGLSINFAISKYYFDVRGYDEHYTVWGCEDDDIIKRFRILGLKITNISPKTSFMHQWHLMYEGLTEDEKKQIEKNREYFYSTGTILRNENGWGMVENSSIPIPERENISINHLRDKVKFFKGRLENLTAKKNDPKDLAVVCCYFNACHYKVRLENYKIFRKGIDRTKVRLLTVELAFGDDPFELSDFSGVLQLRTGKENIMWQKERLLNVGIQKLIKEGYKKIAWLDADAVFEDDNWVKNLSKKLDKYPLVQMYKELSRQKEKGKDDYSYSSASHYRNTKKITGKDARPGLGWGAWSSILEKVPLYDAAVVTTDNDVLNLYGSFRDGRALTVIREKYEYFNHATLPYLFHYMKWAKEWSSLINNRVGFINQKVHALYHGTFKNRRHSERHVVYRQFQFDPEKDIKIGESGAWEWASDKPDLHKEVKDYFFSRNEDD